jgi:hypothetical protein
VIDASGSLSLTPVAMVHILLATSPRQNVTTCLSVGPAVAPQFS